MTSAQTPQILAPVEEIPLGQLVLSQKNARKKRNGSVASMVANIKTYGLLHPLMVEACDDGTFAVVAGGRRLIPAAEVSDS